MCVGDDETKRKGMWVSGFGANARLKEVAGPRTAAHPRTRALGPARFCAGNGREKAPPPFPTGLSVRVALVGGLSVCRPPPAASLLRQLWLLLNTTAITRGKFRRLRTDQTAARMLLDGGDLFGDAFPCNYWITLETRKARFRIRYRSYPPILHRHFPRWWHRRCAVLWEIILGRGVCLYHCRSPVFSSLPLQPTGDPPCLSGLVIGRGGLFLCGLTSPVPSLCLAGGEIFTVLEGKPHSLTGQRLWLIIRGDRFTRLTGVVQCGNLQIPGCWLYLGL